MLINKQKRKANALNNENITKDILSLSSQKKEITFQINQYQSQIKSIQNQLDVNAIEKDN